MEIISTQNDLGLCHFGNSAPSVEIISTQNDLGLCQYEEVFFPVLESEEFIRTTIDVYIPEIQTGTISVFTDITGTKFPFQLRINDTNSVSLLIYSTGQNSTPSYSFVSKKWYVFTVDIYNDHITLAINNSQLISILSSFYQSKWVPIAFGDGAQSSPEQGHYLFDNIKVSAFTKDILGPHNPITILSETDFSSQGWLGLGTYEVPYIITNLEINGSGGHCIQIQNTRSYFIISNCNLSSISFGFDEFSIKFLI